MLAAIGRAAVKAAGSPLAREVGKMVVTTLATEATTAAHKWTKKR